MRGNLLKPDDVMARVCPVGQESVDTLVPRRLCRFLGGVDQAGNAVLPQVGLDNDERAAARLGLKGLEPESPLKAVIVERLDGVEFSRHLHGRASLGKVSETKQAFVSAAAQWQNPSDLARGQESATRVDFLGVSCYGSAMMWRTHFVGGLASLWLLAPVPGGLGNGAVPENFGVLALCAAFGVLLPDLDASDSRLQRLELGPKGYAITPFVLPAQLIHRAWGHRGPLHSLVGLLGAGVVFGTPLGLCIDWRPAVAFLLGYASHLFLDAMTRTGVPLWYPNSKRHWVLPRALRVSTGSSDEEIAFALFSLAAFALALMQINFLNQG